MFPYLLVRLSQNRLDLVKMALQSSPTAYKSSGKVRKLSFCSQPLEMGSSGAVHNPGIRTTP